MERISTLLIASQMRKENGKTKHNTVLRAVRKLFGDRIIDESTRQNTAPMSIEKIGANTAPMLYNTYVFTSFYEDAYGRKQPMYLLTKEQALVICGTFTRKDIVQMIEYITKLEKDKIELLQERTQLLEQQNAKLLQDNTIIEYRYNNLLNVEGTFTTKHIAKELGMSAIRLNKILCEKRIQYRESGAYVLYQKYADKGYGVYRVAHYEHKSGERDTSHYLVWTNKGRDFLLNSVFLKENTLF